MEDKIRLFNKEVLYSLSLISPREVLEIVRISSNNNILKRLRELGLREGSIIELMSRDPFSKKLVIKIEHNYLAIDERLGDQIFVKPIINRYREIREMLYYDPLTGCYKREAFEKILTKLITDPPCGVALADLDDFKFINDSFGHACGDFVLREIGQILVSNVRKQDLVVRWGGEEFLIYISRAPFDIAFKVCERIRKAVESKVILWKEFKIKVTLSIGLCSVPPVRSFECIMELVDKALYRAKREGKNRIIACEI